MTYLPVIGLDLSLTGTGIATPAGCHTISSKGAKGASLRDRHQRLHQLATSICLHVTETAAPRTAYVVIEAPAFDSRTGHQHDRSGLWWLVVDELYSAGHLIAEVTTGGVKKYATGKGNAPKDTVLLAVARRFPDIGVEDNNQADALILRAMGCDKLGAPIVAMPTLNRAALDAVTWPAIDLDVAA